MRLTQPQSQIAKSRARFKVLNCGRRFGKTTLAIEAMKAKAVQKPGRRIAYIATTYQQARDICFEALKKELAPIIKSINESRLELIVHSIDNGESVIILRGWESVETLRGQRFDMLILDEVASMTKFWIGWNEVLRATLTDTKGTAYFISTPKGYNHFYELWLKGQEGTQRDTDYQSWQFTSYDNPHLPKEEIDKARKELTEDAFAQEYLADFRRHTGLIYKEFDRQVHVIQPFEIPNFWQFYRCMDFGAVNPTTCLWITIDSNDNIYVFDEYYNVGQTSKFHAGIINAKTRHPIITTWGDPSAEQEQLDYAQYGVIIAPAVRFFTDGQDWVRSGIDKVRQLLKLDGQTKKPRLYIFNNCVNMIREFETYRWLEQKDTINSKEIPVKENDHCLDALRYFVGSFQARNYTQYQPEPDMQYNTHTGYGNR